MLRIKKYNDGIRVYGYFNCDDYVLITQNGSRAILSAPSSNNSVDELVGEVYDHFNANSYQELANKCQDLQTFVLGNQTKIENFDEVLKELNDDGDVIIELDIDAELDTKEHIASIFNSLKNAVSFKVNFKILEYKSNKGYIKSRELVVFS